MSSSKDRRDSEKTLGPSAEFPDLPTESSYWRFLYPRGLVTKDVLDAQYDGAGTATDPFIISFIDKDDEDPKNLSVRRKWLVVATVSFTSFVASLCSSLYVGTITQVEEHFAVSEEVALLGLSLYVLGLAVGPLLWAPTAETFGRQTTTIFTISCFTIFNAGTVAAENIQSLVILRFLAGTFSASPFVNATGYLADIFDPAERGLAFGFYAATPFLGPLLGPMIGGFLGSAGGWRWVLGLATMLSGLSLVMSIFCSPETFGAVILRRRAKSMSRITGQYYMGKPDALQPQSAVQVYKKAIIRPWAILFREPIVLLLSTWISIAYGTLYLILAGFPIVFEGGRGWNAGQSGLALMGIAVGTLIASMINIPISRRFAKKAQAGNGSPEVRLQPSMVGGLCIPIGLFWFAWTTSPSVPWPASVVGSGFFGLGIVICWTSVNNYLVDAYKIYAASALAGQTVLRSIFGAAFPLFTTYMYKSLGLQWASSIPAFIALACAPMPFIFFKYGAQIRARSHYGSKIDAAVQALHSKKSSA